MAKSHLGRLAGAAEVPQQADWIAAARRSAAKKRSVPGAALSDCNIGDMAVSQSWW